MHVRDRILTEVERCRGEIVELAAELVRIPTVNPPGEHYRDAAELLGGHLDRLGYEVEYVLADGR
ncbi:MAG TPA: succinyl-diaminopimelate desuccinylase, partial [Thermoanaerobaculia bacterium]|nr:succinyl-diaminopimelate desuccinylase [Thermoanaerobaculia bacterium]